MVYFSCLPIYPDKITSWSSHKTSDTAQKQFQRIKKSLLPKTRKEGLCFLQAKTAPHLPRFFYYGTVLICFKFFNLIFVLCRRRCRLQGLPLQKQISYCNRPRSSVSDNLRQQRIRSLSERRSRLQANR